ncbi:MAG: YdeI/OmpD-associated family protein [Bacteroidota bacterium]
MIKTENFEKVEVGSQTELRAWLVTYKKEIKDKYVSTGEVLDELLCFGWIDGIRRKLDDRRTMQLISPRKTQHWAKTYKDRVAKLKKDGKMHEAGLKSIEISKKNGLWNFMDDVHKLIKPNDLELALSRNLDANQFFDDINDSSKRFILRWLKLSKTEKTRESRIQKIVDLLAKGEKLPGS